MQGNNLFGLKNTLFKLCKAKVAIIDTNETKRVCRAAACLGSAMHQRDSRAMDCGGLAAGV